METNKNIVNLVDNIKQFGVRGGCYKPYDKAVCYPIHTQDFVRTGFLDICPTLAARDYKDPKWVVVKVDGENNKNNS